MSEIKTKHLGPTVNLYIDGRGYGSDLTVSCEFSVDEQYKCPFGMFVVHPPREGDDCSFRECGICHKVYARVKALEVAKRSIDKALNEAKEELEDME